MLGITLCSGARGDIGEDSGVPIEILRNHHVNKIFSLLAQFKQMII
jgi:hypothetical protein